MLLHIKQCFGMSLHCLKNYKMSVVFHKLYEFNRGVNIDFALLQQKDPFNMASSVLLNCMTGHSLVFYSGLDKFMFKEK